MNLREPTGSTAGMIEAVRWSPEMQQALSGLPSMSNTEHVVLRLYGIGWSPERIADVLGKHIDYVSSIIRVRA